MKHSIILAKLWGNPASLRIQSLALIKKGVLVMPILSAKESESIGLPLPGPDEYWEDSKWARDHFSDIVREYPDLWVAIVDKKVVAAGSTIEEVERAGKEETGRDEFPIYLAEKGLRVYKY